MIEGDADWSSKLANHLQSPHFIHNVWPRIVEKIAAERVVMVVLHLLDLLTIHTLGNGRIV
jgi:hypothetical protein